MSSPPASPPASLRPLADELWEAELRLMSGAVHMRTRMTVVRREGRALWLHSPIPIDDGLARALDALGEVRDIVEPNRFHSLYAASTKARYPAAKLWAAPGLAERRPAIPWDATLGADTSFGQTLRPLLIEGSFHHEVVFFHVPTMTLICTDLLFNVHDEPHAPTRWMYRALGVWQRFGTNRVWFFLTRDRTALRRSLKRLLEWDVRRVVMAHGDPIELHERDALRRSLSSLTG